MSALGSKLREARIEKGYTLNTLQQMTKIQKKYLQAIEEGNYEDMPGHFYVRAFIKQYADVVGLNGDALIEEYEAETSDSREDEDYQALQESDELPSRSSRYSNQEKSGIETALAYLPLVILVAIIIFIMITLLIAINKVSQSDQTEEVVQNQSSAIVSRIEPSQVSHSESSTNSDSESESDLPQESLEDNQTQVGDQVITLISEPGQAPVYQLEGEISDYEFTAEALSYVWVGMFEDGSIVVDQSIDSGEILDRTPSQGVQEFKIEFGYPEGGKISINGTALNLPSDSYNDAITFVIKDSDQAGEESSTESGLSENPDANPDEEADAVEPEGYQGPAVLDPANQDGE